MLTKIIGDRVYDFSHVVGGRDQVMGPIALAVANDGEVFAITTKLDRGCTVARYSVGQNAGDEEVLNNIGSRGEEPGKFVWPSGIAVDSNKNVYVTDAWMNRVSVFTPDGELLRTFGSSGDGRAQLKRPSGIAIDASDDVLVVDTLNHRIQRLTTEGKYISEWGGHGSGEGELYSPWGITTDADGFVYLADHKNHRIQKFDSDGTFIFELGSHGSGDYGLDHPSDVAVDPEGDIYVCDWANSRVQAFDADGGYITTFVGDAQELSKWQRGIRQQQPGRLQGAPAGVQSRTGVAFRAASRSRFRLVRLTAHGRRHAALAHTDLQQGARLQRAAIQHIAATISERPR